MAAWEGGWAWWAGKVPRAAGRREKGCSGGWGTPGTENWE